MRNRLGQSTTPARILSFMAICVETSIFQAEIEVFLPFVRILDSFKQSEGMLFLLHYMPLSNLLLEMS